MMQYMIRPELVFVQRWRMKCKHCGNQWDSETRAERRVACTKCRSSILLEPGWRERALRVPQPRYYTKNPDTGEEIEIFPKPNTNTTSPVSPLTTAEEESDIKKNVKSKIKSKK